VLFEYAELGKVIRALRREKGLSQEVLSGLAGIARTHLSMIENGTMKASIETVSKIAQALELRPSELLALVEERQENADMK
jgi:transcriptional regulator with XRE-family HTH domain